MPIEYAYMYVVCILKMKKAFPHTLSRLSFRESMQGRYFNHTFLYKETKAQGVLNIFQRVQRSSSVITGFKPRCLVASSVPPKGRRVGKFCSLRKCQILSLPICSVQWPSYSSKYSTN